MPHCGTWERGLRTCEHDQRILIFAPNPHSNAAPCVVSSSPLENIFNEPPAGIIFGRRHTFFPGERGRWLGKREEHSRFFPIIIHALRVASFHLVATTTWPNKHSPLRHTVEECLWLFTIIFVVAASFTLRVNATLKIQRIRHWFGTLMTIWKARQCLGNCCWAMVHGRCVSVE